MAAPQITPTGTGWQAQGLTLSRAYRPASLARFAAPTGAPPGRQHAATAATGLAALSTAAWHGSLPSGSRDRVHLTAVALGPGLDLLVGPDPANAQVRERRREVLARHQLG